MDHSQPSPQNNITSPAHLNWLYITIGVILLLILGGVAWWYISSKTPLLELEKETASQDQPAGLNTFNGRGWGFTVKYPSTFFPNTTYVLDVDPIILESESFAFSDIDSLISLRRKCPDNVWNTNAECSEMNATVVLWVFRGSPPSPDDNAIAAFLKNETPFKDERVREQWRLFNIGPYPFVGSDDVSVFELQTPQLSFWLVGGKKYNSVLVEMANSLIPPQN